MTTTIQTSAAQSASASPLEFPFPESPADGEVLEVAPGILWLRLPLPFRLDHVNVYLLEDDDGWVVFDTGISSDQCRLAWEKVLSGPLAGKRVSKVIVSHYHPDHIGLAGWLCERVDAPLLTGQLSYLSTTNISLSPGALEAKPYHDFYLKNGTTTETADLVSTSGHRYLRMVTPLPPTFVRLVPGDVMTIAGRRFKVLVGEGHAPEQLMLYCADENLFLAADQVLEKTTPNVGVWAVEPHGDPLGLFLRSLNYLTRQVSNEALVLAGHRRPFKGLHERCRQIIEHHHERCVLIAGAVASGPKTVSDLVPVLFTRQLDPHQLSFAFSETMAHVNYMVRRGQLIWERGSEMHRVTGA